MDFEFIENSVVIIPFVYKGYRLEKNEKMRFRCLFRNAEGDFPYTLDMDEDNKLISGSDGKYTITFDMGRYGILSGRYEFDLSLVLESGSLVTVKSKDGCCINVVPAAEGLYKPNGEIFFGADFIVEEGTTDIWHWRKYNSGVAECWGTVNHVLEEEVEAGGNFEFICSLPFAFSKRPLSFIHAAQMAYQIKKSYTLTAPEVDSKRNLVIYSQLESGQKIPVESTASFRIIVKGEWK